MRIVRTYKADEELGRAIARNIATRRKELGLTQKQLADLTGKKQSVIARLERSTYGRHTIHSLNTLAVALDTTVSDLVNTNPHRPTEATQIRPPEHIKRLEATNGQG